MQENKDIDNYPNFKQLELPFEWFLIMLTYFSQDRLVKIKPPNQRKLTVSDRKTGKIFNWFNVIFFNYPAHE
jgi:hypothetical protein